VRQTYTHVFSSRNDDATVFEASLYAVRMHYMAVSLDYICDDESRGAQYLDIDTIIMWMKNILIRLVTELAILQLFSVDIHCDISPCSQWDSTGQTVARTGQTVDSEYQINAAKGMFIDKKKNNLYVADFSNNRVQMFEFGQPDHAAITVASNIDKPMKMFVNDDVTGPTVYV
jgi:hypothetical protein